MSNGTTWDDPWDYQTEDHGETKADTSQMTGYTSARITEIKRIQTALQRANFNPGTIDGIWGPKTCSAMLAFQKSRWGTAKKSWLDMETWAALGFDTSTCKRFTDLYGMACGGTPPAGWAGEGSGTNVQVSSSDINKIQKAIGVAITGTMNKATCEALYTKQRALGNTSKTLSRQLFETLGFTGTDAQKLSTQLGSSCSTYWKATTTSTSGGGGTTPTTPTIPTSPAPKTAGMGLWILGTIFVVAVGGYLWQEMKG
jgi:peptidoglycan hydrolase-like protein with peptidoglycan-binding domain